MAMVKRDFEKEYDELSEAIEVVCGCCVRPSDLEGTGEPCNHCYVRKTWEWYRKTLDSKED